MATAVRVARPSRRRTKYSRNTAGVSFSAIAMPSSIPRGQGVRRGRQSAMTSVISTTLIWPKSKLASMGSRYITASATTPAVSQARRSHAGSLVIVEVGHTARRVSTIQVDSSTRISVMTVMVTLATGNDIQANGLNTMAASGG